MKRHTEVLGTVVTFALPDWFGERKEYMVIDRYPPGHMWAGQEKSRRYENSAHDALFKLGSVKELCYHPEGKWVAVEFACHPRFLPGQIQRFGEKLNRMLNRYKEAR